ncbi:hypothetical protein CVT24_006055 [Panaeolus cyanescens]|uniref:Copper transport protein n=1 Tax=Panaeolus cyanescens TaxID=181874 RepID=A0A409YDS7_9AGAR|nr:hypothetical protein CVT24_006055 [Panaeolus cyanescens]
MSHAGHGDTSGATTGASAHAMMVPYLHVAGGDFLFFEAWAPSSPGALAGATIGLFLLAVLERYLAAVRGSFDLHWRQRARAMTAASERAFSERLNRTTGDSTGKATAPTDIQELSRGDSLDAPKSSRGRLSFVRHIPPFVPSHDIPRGILFGLQMLITYLLMLAVMTFQAAYIIGVVVGLGAGEIMFGRITPMDGGH